MDKLSVTLPDGRTLWFKDHLVNEEKVKRLELAHRQDYPILATLANGLSRLYTYGGRWHSDGPHDYDLIPCDPDEAPAPVVHPISAEHPLVVGDVVRHNRTEEIATVTEIDDTGWAEAVLTSGIGRWWHPTKGNSEYSEPDLFVTRIAHAGQVPEQGEPQEIELSVAVERVEAARRADESELAGLVLAELRKARANYPKFASAHEGYAVLLEEVDELWEAVRLKQSSRSTHREDRIRSEAIQVAAMAMRLILDTTELAKRLEGGAA